MYRWRWELSLLLVGQVCCRFFPLALFLLLFSIPVVLLIFLIQFKARGRKETPIYLVRFAFGAGMLRSKVGSSACDSWNEKAATWKRIMDVTDRRSASGRSQEALDLPASPAANPSRLHYHVRTSPYEGRPEIRILCKGHGCRILRYNVKLYPAKMPSQVPQFFKEPAPPYRITALQTDTAKLIC
jgi:hypothetical protein